MIRIIVTVAALAVIPSAYAQSVPIETDAVINKDAPRGAIDPAVALIRAKGWRCDSVTLLAPTLIEAILEGRQPANLELDDLLQQFPVEWDKQLETLTEN